MEQNIEIAEKTPHNHVDRKGSMQDVVHYVIITVVDEQDRRTIERLSWSGLRWEVRKKYNWYFKYRSALLQVKYPKMKVEYIWGNEPATGITLEQIRQNKIRSKKSKITEYYNKLTKAKLEWNNLFPIEDDIDYKKAVAKIKRLENELTKIKIN